MTAEPLSEVTASRLASVMSAIGWREMAREGESTIVTANTILWALAEAAAGDAPCPKCGHKTGDHDVEEGWCAGCLCDYGAGDEALATPPSAPLEET